MLIVPVQAAPNQTLAVLLANQACQINIYTRSTGLYFDLNVSNDPVKVGVVCQDRNLLIRDAYFGFVGDFWFFDTQGTDDPVFTGLGTRFLLQYLEASDLPA